MLLKRLSPKIPPPLRKYKHEFELKKIEYEREQEYEKRQFELPRLELDHALELKKLELAGGLDEGHPRIIHSSSFDITN